MSKRIGAAKPVGTTGSIGLGGTIDLTNLPSPTGNQQPPSTRLAVFPFDQYEVVLRLSDSGAVIGVEELRINKHFLKASQIGYLDDSEYYRE